jgi:hypothetical protein
MPELLPKKSAWVGIHEPETKRSVHLRIRECIGCLEPNFLLEPISLEEALPPRGVCCIHPRTLTGEWCWGFERGAEVEPAQPAVPKACPQSWRLMMREIIEHEASHWLPWWALPIRLPDGMSVQSFLSRNESALQLFKLQQAVQAQKEK